MHPSIPHSQPSPIEPLEARIAPATFLVNTTADSGPGSLRQAILDANAASGADVITFNFTPGLYTFAPTTPLPSIVSEIDFVGNLFDYKVGPLIALSGQWLPAGSDGLRFEASSDGSSISGLKIGQFSGDGIEVENSSQISVTESFIMGNGTGVRITNSTQVVIGGSGSNLTSPGAWFWGDSNVITANTNAGISVGGGSAEIYGNLIGLLPGSAASANGYGIQITDGTVTIGGAASGAGNVLSGNKNQGVNVIYGQTVTIEGNKIGTDIAGLEARPNGASGIYALAIKQKLTIGGPNLGEGNLVSGNKNNGIFLLREFSPSPLNATIQGNFIGTDVNGAKAIANGQNGIEVWFHTDVLIGGDQPGEGNLISGNTLSGIDLAGANNARVAGNTIGADRSELLSLANHGNGITIGSSQNVTIGGSSATESNLISGNTGFGIWTGLASARDGGPKGPSLAFKIQGNLIGTDVTGLKGMPNAQGGVLLTGSGSRLEWNIVSGNSGVGVTVSGASHVINENKIGVGADGTTALGNRMEGVKFATTPAAPTNITVSANIISGNGLAQQYAGVSLAGTGHILTENIIGLDATGSMAIPNSGIGISGSGFGQILGNTISGNGQHGINLNGAGSGGFTIDSNKIGTDSTGTKAIPNGSGGVRIFGTTATFDQNIISANIGVGLQIVGAATVTRNHIGTDVTGTTPLGNTSDGIQVAAGAPVAIGQEAFGFGNLIGGNGGAGIAMTPGANVSVLNNQIGVGFNGEDLGNAGDGIRASGNNLILSARFNTIGANHGHGISLTLGDLERQVEIESNLIGFASVGQNTIARGNGLDGVHIEGAGAINAPLLSVSHNRIAANDGASIAFKNLDFDNSDPDLAKVTRAAAVIAGNTIGGINGPLNAEMQKAGIGILVDNCTFVRIGTADAGNVIVGQAGTDEFDYAAIRVKGGRSIQIAGNVIGRDHRTINPTGHIYSTDSEGLLIGFDDGGGVRPPRGGVNQLYGSGIYTRGGQQEVIRNEIGDSSLGIMTVGGQGHRFIDNLILNSRRWGIGFDGGGNFAVISGNLITGAPMGGIYGAGTGAIISDNYIEGVGLSGISAPGDGVQIIRNTIVNTDGAAVELKYATNAVVKDNHLSGFTGAGIRFSKDSAKSTGLVDQNFIFDGEGVGIEVLAGQVEVRRNVIFGITGQPIDLGGDGVNPNDLLDLDAGPNLLQNTVVFRVVVEHDGKFILRGTFDGTQNRTLQVEIFGITIGADGSEVAGRVLADTTIVTDNDGHAVLAVTIDSSFAATRIFATVTDAIDHVTSEAAVADVIVAPDVFAVGAGNGAKGTAALVRAGTPKDSVLTVVPYGLGFRGGVHVAHADVNADGLDDLVTAPAHFGRTVKVYSGLDGTLLTQWDAVRGFRGGIFVAAGDVDGDGTMEIVTTLGAGAKPIVQVRDAISGFVESQFTAFAGSRRSGLKISTGDLDGDGDDDIVASWASGTAVARAFTGGGDPLSQAIRPFAEQKGSGAFTAVIPSTGDSGAKIAIGSGFGARGGIEVFDLTGERVETLPMFNRAIGTGLRLTLADVDGDGIANIIASRGTGAARLEAVTPSGRLSMNTLPEIGKSGVFLG